MKNLCAKIDELVAAKATQGRPPGHEPARRRHHRHRPRFLARRRQRRALGKADDGKSAAGHRAARFPRTAVHPLPEIDWGLQIPKRGDQRQMETWQRLGTYGAGLALDDAHIKGDDALCSTMDMVVAAAGGERDEAVDAAILAASLARTDLGMLLNEKLTTELRPTLFLAQLSNLLLAISRSSTRSPALRAPSWAKKAPAFRRSTPRRRASARASRRMRWSVLPSMPNIPTCCSATNLAGICTAAPGGRYGSAKARRAAAWSADRVQPSSSLNRASMPKSAAPRLCPTGPKWPREMPGGVTVSRRPSPS